MRLACVLLIGCGRVNFDPVGNTVDDALGGDGNTGSTTVIVQSSSQSPPCESGCNSGDSHPISHRLLAGTSRLLVVFAGCGEDGTTPATVTYGGLAMLRLGGVVDFGNFHISGEVFFVNEALLSTIPDVEHLVLFPSKCYAGIALQLDNVDQTQPMSGFVMNPSEERNLSLIDVATTDPNALIVDGVSAGRSGDRGMAVPNTQVMRGNVQYNSSSGAGYSMSTRGFAGNPTSMTRGLADDEFPFEVHVGAVVHPPP